MSRVSAVRGSGTACREPGRPASTPWSDLCLGGSILGACAVFLIPLHVPVVWQAVAFPASAASFPFLPI